MFPAIFFARMRSQKRMRKSNQPPAPTAKRRPNTRTRSLPTLMVTIRLSPTMTGTGPPILLTVKSRLNPKVTGTSPPMLLKVKLKPDPMADGMIARQGRRRITPKTGKMEYSPLMESSEP